MSNFIHDIPLAYRLVSVADHANDRAVTGNSRHTRNSLGGMMCSGLSFEGRQNAAIVVGLGCGFGFGHPTRNTLVSICY